MMNRRLRANGPHLHPRFHADNWRSKLPNKPAVVWFVKGLPSQGTDNWYTLSDPVS